MIELTNLKHSKNEPVLDYITHWHILCLECEDRLFETSTMEIWTQDM